MISMDWGERAACKGADPDLFFPPDEDAPAGAARMICRRCMVTAECLEYALERNEGHGVWGGLSPEERQRLRRHAAEQKRAAA